MTGKAADVTLDGSRLLDEYARLKSGGLATEDVLNEMVSRRGILLRGSVHDYADGLLRPTDANDTRLYATNLACIALLNALFSKDGGPVLEYPFYIDGLHPMELKVHRINDATIRERGHVYFISDRSGFFRSPMGAWQYAKNCVAIPYAAKIEVVRKDFTYPVYDVDNGVRLQ